MFTQIFRLAIIVAAFTFAVPAMAQSWQDEFSAAAHQTLTGGRNCGRTMTQHHAESLWADYCTENCAYPGGLGGGGCSRKCGNGGGCDSGSFGYPAGGIGVGGGCGGKLGGCGGKRKGLHGGGCGCKRKGLHDGGCGCKLKGLHGGCGCKLKGLHGGCGCGSKRKGLHGGCGCKLFGGCKKFGRSAEQCGASGAYFNEAVGYEYGTSGMQSCVSCNSCGSFNSLVPEMAAPAMMDQPCCQSQGVVGSAVDSMMPAHMHSTPGMADPAAGAMGALN